METFNWKALAMVLICVRLGWDLLLHALSLRSAKNSIPENVKDIYDQNEFQKWQSYHREHTALGIVSLLVSAAVTLFLFAVNAYARAARWFGEGPYLEAFGVLALDFAATTIIQCLFDYVGTMKIEQKYGFNKTTLKTFVLDQIKNAVISLAIMLGLISLFILLHTRLGTGALLWFSAFLLLFILAVNFLYPVFSKIFNHFEPLPEGDLKRQLTALLEKHGYRVRGIKVMDASRRTTKSNAYFTGFGKMKTIVLYDNLVNRATGDEICAVFAHEMGHGLHKDTLKNMLFTACMIVLIVGLAFCVIEWPQIFLPFGFEGLNYGFGFLLLSYAVLPIVQPLLSLAQNAVSRRAEYKADAQAVAEGYGEQLISALKKLTKENFGNLAPSPLLVKLEYSHPTLSMRIDAIRKKAKEKY